MSDDHEKRIEQLETGIRQVSSVQAMISLTIIGLLLVVLLQ